MGGQVYSLPMTEKNLVAIIQTEARYPILPPFSPPFFPPEYPFSPHSGLDKSNKVYQAVRDLFFKLKMDWENYGSPEWNPLGCVVKKGDKVVIKPNFVLHFNSSGHDLNSVITHGSVIRALMDYIYIALKGKGEIIIADAPQMNADFEKIKNHSGMNEVIHFFEEQVHKGKYGLIKVACYDLRKEQTYYKNGIVWKRLPLEGDPKGYVLVDLGDFSEVKDVNPKRVYCADYNRCEQEKAHCEGHHYYLISKTILDSDVVFSLPKLKTHSKVGVTLNLKNMVGINGNKNYLIHYQVYSPKKGGDEFSDNLWLLNLDRFLKDLLLKRHWEKGKYFFSIWQKVMQGILHSRKSKQIFKGGNWYGNDSAWRMTLDLNKILFFADKNGVMHDTPQRRFFSIIDGIVAGEKNGPLGPLPKKAGILIGGFNPVLVDEVAVNTMGFDGNKIPLIKKMWEIERFRLTDTQKDEIQIIGGSKLNCNFLPPDGWIGHIEK